MAQKKKNVNRMELNMMKEMYIGAKIEDLPIKYGMINFGEVRELAVSSFGYVMNDLMSIRSNFILLGFHLHEIKMCEYYKDFGYDNFYEFCENNFGLKKSSINNYLLVHSTFCEKNGFCLTNRLDKKYSDYNYGQLVELCSVPENERNEYSSKMSVREIREKKCKKVKKNIPSCFSDQTSGQDFSKGSFMCCNDFCTLKGIALQNKIKNAAIVGREEIFIFDENGKQLHSFQCDVLLNGDRQIYFRICNNER